MYVDFLAWMKTRDQIGFPSQMQLHALWKGQPLTGVIQKVKVVASQAEQRYRRQMQINILLYHNRQCGVQSKKVFNETKKGTLEYTSV